MDPQEPIVPTSEPGAPVPSNQVTNPPTNQLTILSMAIFVLLSLGAVAFLYYQNQQLKSMLASYQTPAPSSTPVATADPTANWKTYTNTVAGISFKYPDNLVIDNSLPNKTLFIGFKTTVEQSKNSGGGSGSPYFIDIPYDHLLKNFYELPEGSKIVEKKTTTLGGKTATQYLTEVTQMVNGFNIGDQEVRVIVKDASSWMGVELLDQTQKPLFGQILSTFKFLEVPTASPTATIKPTSSSSGVMNY